PSKGRGVFFSENDKAILEYNIISNNDVQIATYDNSRGENWKNTFSKNIISCDSLNQRLIAVGSWYDSRAIFPILGSKKDTIKLIKGGWFGMFDGLDASTNNNLYFYPNSKAFNSRDQRYGTDKWIAKPELSTPKYTLEEWRKAHLENKFALSQSNRAVDANSQFLEGSFDPNKPVILLTQNKSTQKGTVSFIINRLQRDNYNLPFPLIYKLIIDSKSPNFADGKNVKRAKAMFKPNETFIELLVDLSKIPGLETGDKVKVELDSTLSTAYFMQSSFMTTYRNPNDVEPEIPTDVNTTIAPSITNGYEFTLVIMDGIKKVQIIGQDGKKYGVMELAKQNHANTYKPDKLLKPGLYQVIVKTNSEDKIFKMEIQ
ncbi:MAG: hypothetical protein ACRCVT_16700, partial [Leadbetterella sp.]